MCRRYTFSMTTFASRIAAAACIFVLAAAEAASQLAIDFTTAFERTPIADSNYGWAFSVTVPITIDGLGLWDAGSNGLVENHEVGLWRTFGNVGAPELIASKDVSNNGSIPVASASASGRWLFSPISPLTLEPGSYTIGALYRAGGSAAADPFVSDALPMFIAAGVEFGSTREIHDTETLTCPTNFGLNEHNGFFGPSFRIVPEPSSAILVLAGLSLLQRRRRPGCYPR
jgi:hypothetical protein